ncbi:AHH domain-containing protein [Sorangium sp. So ce726]|uniref:AHH domain-containing protein n=1 Tax=Sorangium sp. So ce726 TaxID=3133319 RepID=UPI003F5F0551
MTTPDVSTPNNAETQRCEWSKCAGLHTSKITYPKGGNVERSGNALRTALLDAKLHPWHDGGYGVPSKPIYLDNGGKITVRVEYRSDGLMYALDAHHLIPIDQMNGTSTLKDNAVLAGWDINDTSNGMCLPSYDTDVAIHELQLHSGSHAPDYTMLIEERLAHIEELYETACGGKESAEFSENLTRSLMALSAHARRKLLAIRKYARGADFLPLHNNSLEVFIRSVQQYNDRRTRYLEQDR